MPKKTTKRTAAKKAPVKKTAVKKTAAKKSSAPAKSPSKKTTSTQASTRKSAAKKSSARTSTAKTVASSKTAIPRGTAKKAGAAKKAARTTRSSASPEPQSSNVKRENGADDSPSTGLSLRLTAALAKVSSTRTETDGEDKRSGPAPFSLEDVREIIKNRKGEDDLVPPPVDTGATKAGKAAAPAPATVPVDSPPPPRPKQSFGAVSMADILGFNPFEAEAPVNDRDDLSIPKKFRTFYKALIDLREDVEEGLMRHSKENLGVSNRDDSGDLSGYAQHMADAGTENFERDFALSMVSSEQEALQEIDDAIARIRDGSYGMCEITGKPINRDRLKAVPFARYSVEGQREIERNQRRKVERGGIFGTSAEDLATFSDEDADE